MPKPKRVSKADDAPTFREHVEAAHRACRNLLYALLQYEHVTRAPARAMRSAAALLTEGFEGHRKLQKSTEPVKHAARALDDFGFTIERVVAACSECWTLRLVIPAFQPIDVLATNLPAAPATRSFRPTHAQVVSVAEQVLSRLLGRAWQRFQLRDTLTDAQRTAIDALDDSPAALHSLKKRIGPSAWRSRERDFASYGQDENLLGVRVADADRACLTPDPTAVARNWKQIAAIRIPEPLRCPQFEELLIREGKAAIDKARPLALTPRQRDTLRVLAEKPPARETHWTDKAAAAKLGIARATFYRHRNALRELGFVEPDSNSLTAVGRSIPA